MNDTVQTAEPAGLKFDTQSALPPRKPSGWAPISWPR
jgi:hypothetical protein